jgi:hypothetical protein
MNKVYLQVGQTYIVKQSDRYYKVTKHPDNTFEIIPWSGIGPEANGNPLPQYASPIYDSRGKCIGFNTELASVIPIVMTDTISLNP